MILAQLDTLYTQSIRTITKSDILFASAVFVNHLVIHGLLLGYANTEVVDLRQRDTSLVSAHFFVSSIRALGCLSGFFSDRFGYSNIASFGAILVSLSCFVMIWFRNPQYGEPISGSVLALGGSLLLTPATILLTHRFGKDNVWVIGFCCSGSAIGATLFSYLFPLMLDLMRRDLTFITIGIFSLLILGTSVFFFDEAAYKNNRKAHPVPQKLLTFEYFILLAGGFFSLFVLSVPYGSIRSCNFSSTGTGQLLAVLALCLLFMLGSIFFGGLATRYDPVKMLIIGAFISGTLSLILKLKQNSDILLLLLRLANLIFISVYQIITPTILMKFSLFNNTGLSFGLLHTFSSISYLISYYDSGYTRCVFETKEPELPKALSFGILNIIGGLLLLTLNRSLSFRRV